MCNFFKKTVFLFLSLVSISSNIYAYRQIASFHDLCAYITPDTMIVLDIDNTVMVPHEYEGSDMWFVASMKEHLDAGKHYTHALDIVLPEYARLQKTMTVRAVEPVIPDFITKWQDAGHTVVGLTNRGNPVIQDTHNLVRSLAIDFSLTAPESSFGDEFLIGEKPVVYESGIIFCTTADKGRSLVEFLRLTGIPQKIICVDDTLAKIVSVEKALTELQAELPDLEFHCFHYTHLHEYIAACKNNSPFIS